jgi:predicted nuclease of predicted toxin-antitoxin system
MRFLAMGVATGVVDWLRDQSHDALHLREQGLQRLPDDQIFHKAAAENRTVLTFDLDFGEIVAFSGRQKVSVVLFRLRNTRTFHVIERLRVALEQSRLCSKEQLLSLKNRGVRVRRLPIGA